ncbi:nipped-B-like protein isoform X2 [Homarus americanus]|uniref:nipped-B-like protein isoform X2 n=1 Tax=Homarus americanus TaxID=6706 RepID=UPI001C436AF8|nr:nipped-B-like protein isoform X2 [Homarus americanus]
MNGEPNTNPQVPVTTLAGIASLTELLPELPLPSSSVGYGDSRSLLFHPRVAEEAQRLLSCQDPALVEQLANSLALTHADHIELKEQYAGTELSVEVKTAPPLLEGILRCNPAVFTGRPGGSEGGASIKAEGGKLGSPLNHTSSPLKPKHINNVSVIQCGPALVNATQVKVKSEPGGALSLTESLPISVPGGQLESQQEDKSLNKPGHQIEKALSKHKQQGDHSVNQKHQGDSLKHQEDLSGDKQKHQEDLSGDKQKHQEDLSGDKQKHQEDLSGDKQKHQEDLSGDKQKHQEDLSGDKQKHQEVLSGDKQKHQEDLSGDKQKQQEDLSGDKQKQQEDLSGDKQKQQEDLSGNKQKQQEDLSGNKQKQQSDKSPRKPVDKFDSQLAHVASEKEKEKVSQNHIPDTKTKESKDNVNAVSKTMKEPVVVLNKLSSEELKSMARIPKLSGVGSNAKTEKNADIPSKNSGSSRRSRGAREASKYKEVSSDSESEDEDKKKPNKYFKNREKEREEKKKKDKADRKRNRIQSDEDDYDPEQETKRRRKGGYQDDEEDERDEDSDCEGSGRGNKRSAPAPALPRKSYTNKRIERKLVAQTEKLTAEELMETGVYQRFNRAVEKIFDNTEDLDLNAEIEEDGDVPQEYLIPKYELTDLCSESAKLKSLGAMAIVPPERLVRLLNILEKNIRDGAKVTPVVDEDDDDDDKLWLELVMERILRAMDASLTAMYIMTAQNMSKRVYLEDVIERCVQFTKFQLSNTIYPSFDPVYRVDNKKDGYVGNMKRKRAQCKDVRNRSILGLYNKLHEVVGLLADLLSIQTLTDTTVLQLSTLGVGPFFVENVSELQLSALRLVTKVFSKYNKHRRLLLDDILASIARLPNSKRSLRTYRLNSDENIQMLTALVLQLIQCVVELPEQLAQVAGCKSASEGDSQNSKDSKDAKVVEEKKDLNMDRDVLVCTRYETAMTTAYSFLSVFLEKTGSKSEEIDYRPLFENFVQDLLATVNKPEWPAAELLLSLLGKLLVQNFSNKKSDMALRVSSLDCLGVVAAKLRRDAVSSQLQLESIKTIIQEVKEEENRDAPMLEDGSPPPPTENGTTNTSNKKSKKKQKSGSERAKENEGPSDEEQERTMFLQRVLLDWLAVNSGSESALLHARHFFIGQWYREAFTEIMRQKQGPLPQPSARKSGSHNKKKRKRKGDESEDETSEDSDEDNEDEGKKVGQADEALVREVTELAEKRKLFLLKKVPAFPPASPGAKTQTLQTHIGYENAELITRYLASKRPFSQSFDVYLKQILTVLTESAIAVRTKAMKCLTMVVEADPGVLSRNDMQLGVHHSFLDHSTSVREAAVDLVGKFVLSRPEVLNTYYEMISARILDTGVSVRKRVIKILKDICLECPDFTKIPEICVKMIRRINDEEGIKKLVQEVFQNMWFTPVRERPHLDEEALLRKVNNITEVVVACRDTGLDWFEQLLHSMFKPREDKDDVTKINTEPPKSLVTACKQIVDCLVRHILVLEEDGQENQPADQPRTTTQRILACHKTLYLFAKIRPQLLVDHAITLQPYLAWRCRTQVDYTMIGVVARTLELVVPLMEHPSETFLSQLEEDAVKLILQHDRTVITSCLALLGSIVNTVTKNYRLIKDCFNRYHSFIVDYKKLNEENPDNPKLETLKPLFRRALYTIGLLLKHFDLKDERVRCGLAHDVTEQVFETLMYFMDSPDMNLRYYTLQALGFVCIRHYELMMGIRLKQLYHMLLLDPSVNTQLRTQTLQNIETYLQEEEVRMIKQDQEWSKQKTRENLKEMCDVQSGMASAIIQVYLKQVLECVVAGCVGVRHSALRVIQLVLAQGLVHPVQIVPYLVCMSTDTEEVIAHSADKQLQDIEKKYPGFIGMKAMQGFRLSYRLHSLIQASPPTRGFRIKEGEHPGALNGFLYSIMRSTKQHRRAVAFSLLKQFEEQARTGLSELLFIADNLAYFPYQVLDEPLFIIHHIDIMISVTGSNLLQAFREALLPPPNAEVKINPETGQPEYVDDLDDEEDVEVYLSRLPLSLTPLVDCINASQGCLLLLMLKDYMKEIYGITDGRITQYSPSDTSKQYEKGASRKSSARFNPKSILKRLKEEPDQDLDTVDDTRPKIDLINQYLNFKALMLKIDPDDDEDSDVDISKKPFQNDTNMPVPNTRSLRGNQNASDVPLLPGTHDGWKDQPKGAQMLPGTLNTVGNAVVETKSDEQLPPRRSPIKPITIRTSQVTPSREHRSHHHHHRSSHRSSSHKKHKKKKKRRRNSDSEDEDSEYSDPDFLV